MVEKETVELFLNKLVRIERIIGGQRDFSRGKLIKVTDTDLVLNFNGDLQAYSLDSIISIREVDG